MSTPPLPTGLRLVDPEEIERPARIARAWLADGADHEEVLSRLRRDGVPKHRCVRVMELAAGLAHRDAKLLVHNSPVWADRREADEEIDAQFWRAAFIMCVLGEGTVNEPEEDVAEWRDRQERSRILLGEIASRLPAGSRSRLDECLVANRLGEAFAEIVRIDEHVGIGERERQLLIEAADALCLGELVDDDEPSGDDEILQAAWRVLRANPLRPGE